MSERLSIWEEGRVFDALGQWTRLLLAKLKVRSSVDAGLDDSPLELQQLKMSEDVHGPHQSNILHPLALYRKRKVCSERQRGPQDLYLGSSKSADSSGIG